MNYKDLIFKMTSNNTTLGSPNKQLRDKYTNNKIYVGINIDLELDLSDSNVTHLITMEIKRILNNIMTSPISKNIVFLPYDFEVMTLLLDLIPEQSISYLCSDDEYSKCNEIKKHKINLINVIKTEKKIKDYIDKVSYIITVNYTFESDVQSVIDRKELMVLPIDIGVMLTPQTQKEKIVKPDGTGWVYNSANGMWVKSWGNDGMQSLEGW